jgi:DNA polymerase III delta' subunit
MEPIFYPATKTQLDNLVSRLAGTYIFKGPRSVGKFTAARWLAAKNYCSRGVCGACRDCKLLEQGAHPGFFVISPDGKTVGIDQVKALQQSLRLSGYASGIRLAVIDEADSLTIEAQNALLKLLEEPPPDTGIILISHGGDNLLPTIISRSRVVNFTPSKVNVVAGYLKESGVENGVAEKLGEWSEGLPGRAFGLADDSKLQENYHKADELVKRVMEEGPFERMVLAASLAEDPGMVELFISRLTTRLRQLTRSGQGLNQIKALERFKRYLKSNVPVKAALESLVLEL